MDMEIRNEIDDARLAAMSGEEVERSALLKFLALPANSEECLYLRSTARKMRDELFGNRISINSSIGLDWAPCAGNCRFCSFGEDWGLVKESVEMSSEDVVGIIHGLYERGYRSFTLRTTEYYELEKLLTMGKTIRQNVQGKFNLGVNTGELSHDDAESLYESGYNSAYHVVRLREGIDTPFDPDIRLRTMENIKRSRLSLGVSIDPLGIEHTDEEILDKMDFLKRFDPKNIGVMRRICVEGTPKGNYDQVSDERLAQIVAVLRIARSDWTVSGGQTSRAVLESGSGSLTLETGASPRRLGFDSGWMIMDHDAAQRLIRESGCEFRSPA